MSPDQYFVTFLPLKGGFSRVIKDANGIPYDYEMEVRPFLCSPSIVPGDILLIRPGNTVIVTAVAEREGRTCYELSDGSYTYFEGNYRVIAEVSFAAKWVKVGDVLSEDQVIFMAEHIEDPLKNIEFTSIDGYVKHLKDDPEFQKEYALIAKIKCGQCGTFH